jgi:hypothetical protein
MRALIQRLNRDLAADYKMVRSPRGKRNRLDLGDYFIVDNKNRCMVDKKLTPKRLEDIARHLDVLASWEEVER